MTEKFLQYVWANSLFRSMENVSTTGKRIYILQVGQENRDAGPDFYNAKIKIDGVLFVGTVEIHSRASDWFKHGHHQDPAYSNVILSVVKIADREIVDVNGRPIHSIVLDYDENLETEYLYLQRELLFPRCHRYVKILDRTKTELFLAGYAVERLERKCHTIQAMLRETNQDWEACFYRQLVRYWAGHVNREAFSLFALNLSYKTILRCADSLFRTEALIFGFSGLLSTVDVADEYSLALQEEYAYQASKFQLQTLSPSIWKFMRVRPSAFPTVRLALLAALLYRYNFLFSRLLEAETISEVKHLLDVEASDYWKTHYKFGHISPSGVKKMGTSIKEILIINALIPFIFVYGKERGEERFCEKSIRWLEELKSENNQIIRAWEKYGLPCRSALYSQAILEIKQEFCDRHRCLECKIGLEVFKHLKK